MKHNAKNWFLLMIVVFVFALFAISCNKDQVSETTNIKIGVLLGFSGTGSQNAVETKAALDIGLQEVNTYIQTGGINATVELFYEDTKSDTSEAGMKAQLLINKGVSLIIGPYTSAEARAVKSIVNDQDILLVSHSAVSTSLAIPDDNLLRFAPCDSYQAEAITAMFLSDSIKAIIPVVRNDLWSNSLAFATVNTFIFNDGESISPQSFEPGTIDFSALIANIKSVIATGTDLYGADRIALYLISYSDGTNFLEALSDAGLTENIKIYGASAFAQSTSLIANNTAAGFAMNAKLQCPVFGFDESASEMYEPIQSQIENEIGTRASIYALAAYDILWATVIASITIEPTAGFTAFKSHFIQTAADYFGATGSTQLDENGDRKNVYYDFWTINKEEGLYTWKLSAKYNTVDHNLIKF